MGSHWDSCVASVTRYADGLWDAVRRKKLNESAVEGLIESYLEQPAYYPEWRARLLEIAMSRRSPEREKGAPAEAGAPRAVAKGER